jgi:hypothetical protein
MVLGAVLAAAASAQYPVASSENTASLYLWNQDFSGSIGGRGGTVLAPAGGDIDAGFQEDSASSVGLSANLRQWEIGFLNLENESTGLVTSSFTFDGSTYTAGESFRISQSIQMFDLFRRHALVRDDMATIRWMFGFKILDVDLDARTAGLVAPAAQGNVSETVPLPMLGLSARFGQDRGVFSFASVKYFDLEVSDVSATITDLQLGVGYQFERDWRVNLGWRSYEFEASIDESANDQANLNLENEGVFFEVGLRFGKSGGKRARAHPPRPSAAGDARRPRTRQRDDRRAAARPSQQSVAPRPFRVDPVPSRSGMTAARPVRPGAVPVPTRRAPRSWRDGLAAAPPPPAPAGPRRLVFY